MRNSCVPIIVIALVLGVGSHRKTHGDTIASFQFEGNTYTEDPSNNPGFNVGLNLSNSALPLGGILAVSDLRFSPNLDPTAGLGFGAPQYNDALGLSANANSDFGLLTTSQTVYFDVDIQSGFRLNLESLNFDSLKTRAGNARGSRVTHSIFVNPVGDPSVDGLEGDFDFIQNVAHDHFATGEAGAESTGPSFSTGRWSAGPIGLSSFQNLTGTTRVAIRLYSDEQLNRDFGLDNIVLSGNAVAIPEPGSFFALAFFASGVAFRRRRSRGGVSA